MRTAWLGAIALAALGFNGTAALAQDVENGQSVFRQCRACHQIGASAKNLVGPQLNGIVGRKAGTVDGFNYSEANKAAGAKGLVWDEATLSSISRTRCSSCRARRWPTPASRTRPTART